MTTPAPAALPTGFATASLWVSVAAFFLAFPSRTLGMLLGILAVSLAGYHINQVMKNRATGKTKAIWAMIVGSVVAFVCLVAIVSPTKTIAAPAYQYTPPSQAPGQYTVPVSVAPVAEVPEKPQVINPKIVGDAVESNKARAAANWDGKYVQFTAEVTDISTAFVATVNFGNVTSKQFSMVQFACYPGEESALLPFSKGEKATVRGVIKVGFVGVIELNDCVKV